MGTPHSMADAVAASGAMDDFDTPDDFDSAGTGGPETPYVRKVDPMRPEAKRGRYTLPNPENGKSRSWQRVTNLVKLTDDTHYLELWKQRNVAKGIAILVATGRITLAELSKLDVKADRDRLNKITEAAQDAAEAYKNSDEGTALHKSTELADFAGGDITKVPMHHRVKVQMYLDCLTANGLTITPGMIERVTASLRYDVAGKFDRIVTEAIGAHVILDLKTGDDLDLSFPSIAAQLRCYEDGINEHGVFDGQRYDTSIRVRSDYGIVVHLPSTRDEVALYKVDLASGTEILSGCLHVKGVRKIKAKHVAAPYVPLLSSGDTDAQYIERMNAVSTIEGLLAIRDLARRNLHWNKRLGDVARNLAAELKQEAL